MTIAKIFLLTCLTVCGLKTTPVSAQKTDSIIISGSNLNMKALREGTSRYLVYVKMNKDSVRTFTQFWTRTTKRTQYKGMAAIEITQEWEDKDSIIHIVNSISDAVTMQPLYHKTWWKVKMQGSTTSKTNTTTVDLLNKTIEYNGKLLNKTDTARQEKKIMDGYLSAENKYFLNWHLDLETFPLLPYEKGKNFIIPFYDPGTASGFQNVTYSVKGSAELTGYDDQKIACWLLVHEEKGNQETFWISKKTKEVLKLEQVINGSIYRYKIKLGFCN